MGKKTKIDDKPSHVLFCRHCIGVNCRNYTMKCILLKITKNGKAKILLFGERYWKGRKKRSIRYVDRSRLQKINWKDN